MKKKGFTLIEVMVVAVIVAILAAVAIPAYRNYISRSANNVAKNVAGTVAQGVATWIAEHPNETHSTGTMTGPNTWEIDKNISVKIPEYVTITVAKDKITASHTTKGTSTVSVPLL